MARVFKVCAFLLISVAIGKNSIGGFCDLCEIWWITGKDQELEKKQKQNKYWNIYKLQNWGNKSDKYEKQWR